MTTMTEATIGGITFDCEWYVDDDGLGSNWVELQSVYVGGQDLTGIINHEWWDKIEKLLVKYYEECKK